MNEDFLTTRELAKRWHLEPDTLKKWRIKGIGPLYHKLGKGIRYNFEDIEEFEKVKLRCHTSMPEPPPTYLSKIADRLMETKPSHKKPLVSSNNKGGSYDLATF
jgi:hypothetical protein